MPKRLRFKVIEPDWTLRSSGRIAEYNAAVPAFNAEVSAYNQALAKLRTDIAYYNQLVVRRNAIALELEAWMALDYSVCDHYANRPMQIKCC